MIARGEIVNQPGHQVDILEERHRLDILRFQNGFNLASQVIARADVACDIGVRAEVLARELGMDFNDRDEIPQIDAFFTAGVFTALLDGSSQNHIGTTHV